MALMFVAYVKVNVLSLAHLALLNSAQNITCSKIATDGE